MSSITMTLPRKCLDTLPTSLEEIAADLGGTLDFCDEDGGYIDLVISAPTKETLLHISRMVADSLIRKAIAGTAR